MKKQWLYVTAALSILALTGCGEKEDTTAKASGEQDKVLEYQSMPSSVSYAELAESLGYLGDLELKSVSDMVGGPESIQYTATGQIDFGWAFNGAIIQSVTKGVEIRAVVGAYGSDENTYSGVYTLEGSNIKTAKDLVGKKIGVNSLGGHAEFVVKQYLRDGGLTEAEIKKTELIVVPSTSAEQVLRSKQVDAVLLGGIFRDIALERGDIKPLFKDTDLIGNFTAGEFFFTNDYIEQNPDTVKTFVEGTAKAIEWARTTSKEEVIEKYVEIVEARDRNQSTDNVKYFESTGIAEEGGVVAEQEFQLWLDWLVKSGTIEDGKYTASDFYTNEFNPYTK